MGTIQYLINLTLGKFSQFSEVWYIDCYANRHTIKTYGQLVGIMTDLKPGVSVTIHSFWGILTILKDEKGDFTTSGKDLMDSDLYQKIYFQIN